LADDMRIGGSAEEVVGIVGRLEFGTVDTRFADIVVTRGYGGTAIGDQIGDVVVETRRLELQRITALERVVERKRGAYLVIERLFLLQVRSEGTAVEHLVNGRNAFGMRNRSEHRDGVVELVVCGDLG